MEGYRNRERAIAEAAERLDDPYVVVLDLRKFYPSIDRNRAYERFKKRVETTSITGDEIEAVLQSAMGVCRPKKMDGLPIGPPLSHVIASIYLENVDARLEREFPGRYFRYVDDIAIVVDKSYVDSTKFRFDEIVESEGLFANEDKTDVHPSTLWKTHVESKVASQHTVAFGELVSNLTQYLAHNPDEFDSLHARFRSEGFSLPFTRVKSIAQYGPFRRLAKKAFEHLGMSTIVGSVKPEELLRNARGLRTHFEDRASHIAATDIPSGGMERRWAIQNLRFTFNRLLYLAPREELSKYVSLLPDIDDVVQTKEVYKAMIQGDISNLVHFAGPTVSAFAQLWTETQTHQPHIDWSMPPKAHERDAVITLALYGLCEPPADWIAEFKSRTKKYSQTALKLAARPFPTERTHNDFSYIDELESLFLGPRVDGRELLNTRFDKGEDVVLPALSLGAGYELEIDLDY